MADQPLTPFGPIQVDPQITPGVQPPAIPTTPALPSRTPNTVNNPGPGSGFTS